ncbi:hypothetical protein CLOL250_00333 [Clostridium sp. L2-50]|nr:hypothetical protein CLOL250_00333 [Clostridium sp. L2-50]
MDFIIRLFSDFRLQPFLFSCKLKASFYRDPLFMAGR